jgi:RNA polymerase sigma factor (sigma-70 family)
MENVMPHEANVRAWLRHALVPPDDIDDLVQEAYCKLAALQTIDHIDRPDAYFFQIVRNLLNDQLRRARVVRIETIGELTSLSVASEEPSPERVAVATRELERVRGLIGALPERCRQVLELRKLDGLSQRQVARRLGISESVVENEGVKGMRLILSALRSESGIDDENPRNMGKDERPRKLKRD